MTDQPPRSFSELLKSFLPPGAPEHNHDPDHEPSFPEYLISLRTMEPRQRALTGLVLAQIIVSALALMLRNAEAPSLRIEGEGVAFGISTINYLLSVASLIVALMLLSGGMLYARVLGRWLFLLSLAGLYLLVLLGLYHGNIDDKIGVLSLVFGIPLALLAGADMPASYKSHYNPERQQPPRNSTNAQTLLAPL